MASCFCPIAPAYLLSPAAVAGATGQCYWAQLDEDPGCSSSPARLIQIAQQGTIRQRHHFCHKSSKTNSFFCVCVVYNAHLNLSNVALYSHHIHACVVSVMHLLNLSLMRDYVYALYMLCCFNPEAAYVLLYSGCCYFKLKWKTLLIF